LAQSAERLPSKQKVGGSIPPEGILHHLSDVILLIKASDTTLMQYSMIYALKMHAAPNFET
jgi:hypothetical protein